MSGICNDVPTTPLFCDLEGSNTPWNVRHMRPRPSTPVCNSCSNTNATLVPNTEQSGSGRLGFMLSTVSIPDTPSKMGNGDDRGAKTRCARLEAAMVTPHREMEPWTTQKVYAPRRQSVSPGSRASTVPGLLEDETRKLCTWSGGRLRICQGDRLAVGV